LRRRALPAFAYLGLRKTNNVVEKARQGQNPRAFSRMLSGYGRPTDAGISKRAVGEFTGSGAILLERRPRAGPFLRTRCQERADTAAGAGILDALRANR
jgi:hypothetical protein